MYLKVKYIIAARNY